MSNTFAGGADAGTRARLLNACRDARREFREILKVVELLIDPKDPDAVEDSAARHIDPRYEKLVFRSDDDSGHAASGGNFGGFTQYFNDTRGGDSRAAVFLLVDPTVDEQNMAMVNLAILAHELGHIDDFARGLHLVPGKPLDVVAAEFHANRYACQRLSRMGELRSLSFWLASIERFSSRCGVPQVERAAKMLMDLPEYQNYRKQAAPVVANWSGIFIGAK